MLERFFEFVCALGSEPLFSPDLVLYFKGAFKLSLVVSFCTIFVFLVLLGLLSIVLTLSVGLFLKV